MTGLSLGAAHASAWPEAALAWRDRLLASARFRRWAAAVPGVRLIARRRAAALFDLAAGFVYSQVLLGCVQLRLFDRLAAAPATAAELAAAYTLGEPQLERLLAAAAALDLVEHRRGGRYGLGPLGAALVGESGLAALVEHHGALYRDLAEPLALLRGDTSGPTRLASFWPYAASDEPAALQDEQVARYSALMTASLPMVAEQLLAAVSMRGVGTVLDVGGGEGAFVQALAARAPQLRLMLFDLPAVAARARARLAALGLGARVAVRGGSFLHDELPLGADLVTLVRVLHDHDDEPARQLLSAVHRALPAGGRVVVAEPMAGTAGARAMGDAYFGIYLAAMRSGRPRSAAGIGALLAAAGFCRVQVRRTRQPLLAGVVEAVRAR